MCCLVRVIAHIRVRRQTNMQQRQNDNSKGKLKKLRQQHAPVPLYPPWTSQEDAWNLALASTVRSQCLTQLRHSTLRVNTTDKYSLLWFRPCQIFCESLRPYASFCDLFNKWEVVSPIPKPLVSCLQLIFSIFAATIYNLSRHHAIMIRDSKHTKLCQNLLKLRFSQQCLWTILYSGKFLHIVEVYWTT